MKEDLEKIKQEKSRWEEKTLKPALDRFKLTQLPQSAERFCSFWAHLRL